MDLQYLEAFVTVVELKSVKKAAEKLFLSTSAIAFQIKSLENEIGFNLFERLHRGMKVTPRGNFFYIYALKALKLSKQLKCELGHLQEIAKGRLDIGASRTTATYYFPVILKKFLKSYPDVTLNVYTSYYHDILESVRSGKVEIAIVKESPRQDLENSFLLCTDHIIPVVHGSHPLASGTNVSPKDINEFKIISFSPHSQEWDLIQQWFVENDVAPHIGMTHNHLETIKELLLRTDHVSFLPRYCVNEELEQRVLCTFAPNPPIHAERKTYLAFREEKLLSPTAKAFMELILNHPSNQQIKGL